jgi:hypothetical protein
MKALHTTRYSQEKQSMKYFLPLLLFFICSCGTNKALHKRKPQRLGFIVPEKYRKSVPNYGILKSYR